MERVQQKKQYSTVQYSTEYGKSKETSNNKYLVLSLFRLSCYVSARVKIEIKYCCTNVLCLPINLYQVLHTIIAVSLILPHKTNTRTSTRKHYYFFIHVKRGAGKRFNIQKNAVVFVTPPTFHYPSSVYSSVHYYRTADKRQSLHPFPCYWDMFTCFKSEQNDRLRHKSSIPLLATGIYLLFVSSLNETDRLRLAVRREEHKHEK